MTHAMKREVVMVTITMPMLMTTTFCSFTTEQNPVTGDVHPPDSGAIPEPSDLPRVGESKDDPIGAANEGKNTRD